MQYELPNTKRDIGTRFSLETIIDFLQIFQNALQQSVNTGVWANSLLTALHMLKTQEYKKSRTDWRTTPDDLLLQYIRNDLKKLFRSIPHLQQNTMYNLFLPRNIDVLFAKAEWVLRNPPGDWDDQRGRVPLVETTEMILDELTEYINDVHTHAFNMSQQ
eukprot:1049708-Rhodomonas_salina.1